MRVRVLDLETATDAPPPDTGVCEIGWADVVSTGTDLLGKPANWIVEGTWRSFLVNPERPIEPKVSAIHHIIDADVWMAPKFQEVWRTRASVTEDGEPIDAFAAHSAKFERSHISDEMTAGKPWICTYKCALRLWPDLLGHSNQAIRYARNPVGLEREKAFLSHRAGPDAYVSAFHLRDQLELAPIEDLVKWSSEPALQSICHIGKQRGKRWTEVDSGFLYWLLDKDFDEDVIFTARHELARREKENEGPEFEEVF